MIAYQIVFDFSESGTIDKLTGLPQTLISTAVTDKARDSGFHQKQNYGPHEQVLGTLLLL